MTSTATVKITYTEQAFIRCVARVDMPEYSIVTGDIFYLSRSSKGDGTYYITRWDYKTVAWMCSCPSIKPCRHIKAVSVACVRHAAFVKVEQQRVQEAQKASDKIRYADVKVWIADWQADFKRLEEAHKRQSSRETVNRLELCGLMRGR